MGEPIRAGRYRADFPEGTVVFLIGMRINSLRKIRSWWPVFMAMPGMLRELVTQPDLGLRGARLSLGGRTITSIQYWESMDHLMAYARDRDREHLPAWKSFNQRLRQSGDAVGIWHEAYVVDPARSHTVYQMMPDFGVGKATTSTRLSGPG